MPLTDVQLRPDWTTWAQRNRITEAMDKPAADPFDATVSGPWLQRWSEETKS